jgi:NTE family protein
LAISSIGAIDFDDVQQAGKQSMESKKIGLALSGGGYRAMLFGLGTLIRLNEMGVLKRTSRITSVSGGSILNGYLATKWEKLNFEGDVATNFKEEIADGIYAFCGQTTLSKFGMITGKLIPMNHPSNKVKKKYDKLLYHNKPFSSLTSIPGAPQFLFYGTNLQTGRSVRMVDSLLFDYKIGAASIADLSISQVVTISGAFPPVLSPVTIDMKAARWARGIWSQYHDNKDYTSALKLCDGGLYDNMGIECLWKKTRADEPQLVKSKEQDPWEEKVLDPWNRILEDDIDICLVSDSGAPFQYSSDPGASMVKQVPRIIDILTEQTRALRKRQLLSKYLSSEEDKLNGTFWGIATRISDYELDDSLPCDKETSESMGDVPTTLSKMSDEIRSRLINWGYALADAAIRKHAPDILAQGFQPPSWPCPDFGLEQQTA